MELESLSAQKQTQPWVRISVLVGLLIFVYLAQAFHISQSPRAPGSSDFDVFYLVGHMFWSGELADAYQGNLRALSGEIYPGLRWTYPPPYILFVAPLALVPEWAAYLIFMGLSLTGYVAMLYALGGRNFELSLRVSIPAISVSLAAGQNGLVFGIIIAAILRAVSSMQGWSGLGLALLMMKPQLFPVACAYEIRE